MDFRKNVLANFKQYLDNNKNIELQLKKDEYEKHCIIEENKLMFHKDNNQKRIVFYDKLGVKKLDMYVEYLFDCYHDNTPIDEIICMYNTYLTHG
jgi:hypothetical protein